jgi:signal transduction histidine kinase
LLYQALFSASVDNNSLLYTEKQDESSEFFGIALVDITDTQKTLSNLRLILILCGAGMFCVFFIGSLFLANRLVRPVEASWQRQRQFMSDASHELKTPLSIISANHEILQKNRDQTIESQIKWLDSNEAETGRMSKLVTALLDLSSGDESLAVLASVDMSRLTEEVCAGFEAVAFEKNVKLTTTVEPGLMIIAEEEGLRTALAALFDNAVKYTPDGSEISASLAQKRDQVVFALQNTGVSIPKEDLAHLCDRFYRVDQARSHDTGGFGLGLSVAQNAIRRSGGTLDITSDESSVTATVRFSLI